MALDSTLSVFRAVGEESRMRIIALLTRGELTVSEITGILGQSQPRVSRHLKILADAGLAERHREGAWMFYRLATNAECDPMRAAVLQAVAELCASGDRIIARDEERFQQSRQARADIAAAYFQANAKDWNTIRRLHLPEPDIEAEILALLGDGRIEHFIDIGTGAGRMLEVFADRYASGTGFDLSHEMLAIARTNMEKNGMEHAQVRHGDLFSLPLDNHVADVVCIHHVLHYLAEPGDAVRESARLLKPGGAMIISDFAPHQLEFLRDAHAHRRLGFSDDEVQSWCRSANLQLEKSRTLSPRPRPSQQGDPEKLTVKIWLLRAPDKMRRLPARNFA